MAPARSIFCLGLALAVAASALHADDKPETLDPEGKWPRYAVGQPRRVHVWHSGDSWHVRTTTRKNQTVNFTGMVKIVGGVMTDIGGFGGLETGKGKKPEQRLRTGDWGTWNKEKTQLQFKFSTKGMEDGFDFKVSDKAESVEFSFSAPASEIFIGKNGQHPSTSSFTLPAHPGSKK